MLRSKRPFFCCLAFLTHAWAGVSDADCARCNVDFYFTPACEQCRYVEEHVLPQLADMFGPRVIIRKHNLYDPLEFAEFRDLPAKLDIKGDDNVFCVIDGRICVGGARKIAADLIPIVEERLNLCSGAERFDQALRNPAPAPNDNSTTYHWLKRHSFPFSFLTITAAGLIDGFNPCAFAAIVFLVSVLMVGSGTKRRLLWTGTGFCIAVYLTYFLIGLGLFQAFRLSLTRLWLNNVLHRLLIILLLVMAVLSFRDAWLFRVTGRQDDLILRLPKRINRLIHYLIRENMPHGYFMAGGFFIGCMVTLLESICTGQLYVPTLLFLAKTSSFKLTAVGLLAFYNLMFVLPLMFVFVLAYHGVNNAVLAAWSKKDVFLAKCLLGAFFIFLAAVLCLT